MLIGLYVSHCPQAIPISRFHHDSKAAEAPGRGSGWPSLAGFLTPGKTQVKVGGCGAARPAGRVRRPAAQGRGGGLAFGRPGRRVHRQDGARVRRGPVRRRVFPAHGPAGRAPVHRARRDRDARSRARADRAVRGQGYTPEEAAGRSLAVARRARPAASGFASTTRSTSSATTARSTAPPTSSSPRSRPSWKVVRVDVEDALTHVMNIMRRLVVEPAARAPQTKDDALVAAVFRHWAEIARVVVVVPIVARDEDLAIRHRDLKWRGRRRKRVCWRARACIRLRPPPRSRKTSSNASPVVGSMTESVLGWHARSDEISLVVDPDRAELRDDPVALLSETFRPRASRRPRDRDSERDRRNREPRLAKERPDRPLRASA